MQLGNSYLLVYVFYLCWSLNNVTWAFADLSSSLLFNPKYLFRPLLPRVAPEALELYGFCITLLYSASTSTSSPSLTTTLIPRITYCICQPFCIGTKSSECKLLFQVSCIWATDRLLHITCMMITCMPMLCVNSHTDEDFSGCYCGNGGVSLKKMNDFRDEQIQMHCVATCDPLKVVKLHILGGRLECGGVVKKICDSVKVVFHLFKSNCTCCKLEIKYLILCSKYYTL